MKNPARANHNGVVLRTYGKLCGFTSLPADTGKAETNQDEGGRFGHLVVDPIGPCHIQGLVPRSPVEKSCVPDKVDAGHHWRIDGAVTAAATAWRS